jgi:butyrate kinase
MAMLGFAAGPPYEGGMMTKLILVINPGSTSTKLALFSDESPLVSETIYHDSVELAEHPRILDQLPMRSSAVRGWLAGQLSVLPSRDGPSRLDAIAARGGLLHPLPSGVYLVDATMLDELHSPETREHAANLAALIAAELASEHGVPAFIVDPVCVDEMDDVARISGLPDLPRISMSHALSLKAAARRAAADMGERYEDLDLVVAHLGGGISVSAHRRGRMIDVNNANDMGPFSPERVGTLPLTGLVRMLSSTQPASLRRRFWGAGGMVAHLGTNDAREVERRIAAGDGHAELVYRAMAYQVAKEIGAMAAALGKAPCAIVLTGGLAHSKVFTELVQRRISFIAPVMIYPAGAEMEALARGTLRALNGQEKARSYCDAIKNVSENLSAD